MCKKGFHAQIVLDFVEVFGCVLVGHVSWTDVEFEVWSIVLEIVVVGQLWKDGGGGRREGSEGREGGGVRGERKVWVFANYKEMLK